MPKASKTRPASSTTPIPPKRRKLSSALSRHNPKAKAADRTFIQVPIADGQDDADLSDQDFEVFTTYGAGATFLQSLDQKGISLSKKETDRRHKLDKPLQRKFDENDLLSIHSANSEDEEDLSSEGFISLYEDEETVVENAMLGVIDSDSEQPYEIFPRPNRQSNVSEAPLVLRLPIKLADGRIMQTGTRQTSPKFKKGENDSELRTNDPETAEGSPIDDVSTAARFGRPAVIDVIQNESRKLRIQSAKDQIAGICQDIVADPENSLGLLRRLHTFSLEKVSSPSHPEPILNDPLIRKLAMLSQLAVFKDIIPGYRIRQLTEKETAEKVSQIIARTRDWEQGLVVVYQSYLKLLETEMKGVLADVAHRCICTLAVEATHFNFRVNLMSCMVARLSKRSWTETSEMCLSAVIDILRADLTGMPSLEIVRLLNRMIKEKRFNVSPKVLSCLLHLRVKTELSTRTSESVVDKPDNQKTLPKGKIAARRAKGKPTAQPHLNKRMKKLLKENKDIEREFREAEAEVDKEERAITHTETLKLLFVLYFHILKNPYRTPLLLEALKGISKYAHLVNIDFFQDLMAVLKELITQEDTNNMTDDSADNNKHTKDIRHRLQCIVTAFELLSGQGEALNVDLGDFISHLYTIIPRLSFTPGFDIQPLSPRLSKARDSMSDSMADMLFRALHIIFSPRTSGAPSPPWRSAAFAKRLLTASLHWPPGAALRTLGFIGSLVAKDPRLEALLSTEDRTLNGVYSPWLDDPQLSNPFGTSFWELYVLQKHFDGRVRTAALSLLNYTRP